MHAAAAGIWNGLLHNCLQTLEIVPVSVAHSAAVLRQGRLCLTGLVQSPCSSVEPFATAVRVALQAVLTLLKLHPSKHQRRAQTGNLAKPANTIMECLPTMRQPYVQTDVRMNQGSEGTACQEEGCWRLETRD